MSGVVTEKDSVIYGRASVYLEGRRSAVRTQETNIGNLTADANLAAAKAIDSSIIVSLKNGGGIRAEIGSIDGTTGEFGPTQANSLSGKVTGQISQLDIENTLRFNNNLTALTVSVAELKAILEHGVAATSFGATPGRFPQVAGLRFSFNPHGTPIAFNDDGTVAQPGTRIQSLAIVDSAGEISDVIVEDGVVVGDPDRAVRMVTLGFLAGGGDGYPFPSFAEDQVDLKSGDNDLGEQEALANFLTANHADEPYAVAETPIYLDTRIQNLSARGDSVLAPLSLTINPMATYFSGQFDAGAAEIATYDPESMRVFFTQSDDTSIGILDIRIPEQPVLIGKIDVSPYGDSPTSVDVSDGVVAVAVPAADDADDGSVVFFDVDGEFLNSVKVGNLPDMLTFTPDGKKILVANEGEPLTPDFEETVHARFATFNVSLNRSNAGDLITELSDSASEQAANIAEVIQRSQADVLLLNEFDFDEAGEAIDLFRANYLQVSQNGQKPAYYPYVYIAPSNTGIQSGFDLNNDGEIGGPNNAFGFGNFEGQYGMAVLSRYPIVQDHIRTFQNFLWKDMPGANLPDNPDTEEPNDWYSADELEAVRLSSKSHWDVPVDINGTVFHVLASHPTPPVFDGPEDANGLRNHDEIRFWNDYVTPEASDYIIDDNGGIGGIQGDRFVIMGDLNADPLDGDSTGNPVGQLLNNPFIDSSQTPASEGGAQASERQGSTNNSHGGNPAFDTADFGEEEFGGPGNLRVDYVLPSTNIDIVNSGVYWPTMESPEFRLTTDFPPSSSDHRLVFSDLASGTVDPAGGVSIINMADGVMSASVNNLNFLDMIGREDEFRTKGVRVFPGKNVYQDFEPEYIAVSPDGATAMVTLQEANAFAVIDIAAESILDVIPLGVEDHTLGDPVLEMYPVVDLPDLDGQTPAGQTIKLGGFSGLYFAGRNPNNGNPQFLTIPDRGPNPETGSWDADGDQIAETVRPLALPDYQSRIVTLETDMKSGETRVVDQLMLTRPDPANEAQTLPITGRPNIFRSADGIQIDEFPVDLNGNPLELDPFGGDMEAIVVQPSEDGSPTYWTIDEYRPALYHFDSNGQLLDRFVPQGTAELAGQPIGSYGTETLPSEYISRRRNRGFEALALNAETGVLYAFIQTPLANPDRAASDQSDVIRILGIDSTNGQVVEEYVYALEDIARSVAPSGRVDKIGDAVWSGDGKMLVIERDSGVGPHARKPVFQIDMLGATNLRAADSPITFAGKSLEQHTIGELVALGIRPVHKTKLVNLPTIGYVAGDKPEGLAIMDDGSVAVLNDNDFTLADVPIFDELGQSTTNGGVIFQEDPTIPVLGVIRFDGLNGIDGSDVDGRINISQQPLLGYYMPDSVASFQAGGETYFMTANEGDARDEDVAISTIVLDETAFPNAAELQLPENLGNLIVSANEGDLDGDGDYDRLFSYGTRSFSIFDSSGNLIFDSGQHFEEVTANYAPGHFNADGDDVSFEARSDDKGPEPEAIATGTVGTRVYSFIGLERVGGIMVYDVTDPSAPEFLQYINNRDFDADLESNAAGDIGVESLLMIPASHSPNGQPILVAANEVSGTVTLFEIAATSVAGDFNEDGGIDAQDLEVLGQGVGRSDSRYDVNQDGHTNDDDHRFFLANLFSAAIGDSNLDGVFDSADLITVFNSDEYEDGFAHNSGWSEGDWNGDGDFDSSDFVFAMRFGAYVAEASPKSSLPSSADLIDSAIAAILAEADDLRESSEIRPFVA